MIAEAVARDPGSDLAGDLASDLARDNVILRVRRIPLARHGERIIMAA